MALSPWLLIARDFIPTGGMDAANLYLAMHLAGRANVEIVAHRADIEGATLHKVHRPFGRDILGEGKLRSVGLRKSHEMIAKGGHVLANGGNCPVPAANWVHYIHTAYRAPASGTFLRRWKDCFYHRRALRWEREALTVAKVIIANSALTGKQLVEHFAIDARKIHVVYYGTDPVRFGSIVLGEREAMRKQLGWDDRPWLIFIGGLGDRRKGFDVLYAAWKVLCAKSEWDANLAVIGRGAELAHWKNCAKADGIADRISFLGFRDDVPNVLAAADAMVHPARYEAYGLGVHEAMCRGLPALVSANAGVAERYPEQLRELLLANPDDPEMLVERLQNWYANRASFQARAIAFSGELRSRTWAHMAEEIRTIVEGTA